MVSYILGYSNVFGVSILLWSALQFAKTPIIFYTFSHSKRGHYKLILYYISLTLSSVYSKINPFEVLRVPFNTLLISLLNDVILNLVLMSSTA